MIHLYNWKTKSNPRPRWSLEGPMVEGGSEGENMEAQRGDVIWPTSHSQWVSESGLGSGILSFLGSQRETGSETVGQRAFCASPAHPQSTWIVGLNSSSSPAANREHVPLMAGSCHPPARRPPDTGLKDLSLHLWASGDDSNETVMEKNFHPTHVFSLQPNNQHISWHLGSIGGRWGCCWW